MMSKGLELLSLLIVASVLYFFACGATSFLPNYSSCYYWSCHSSRRRTNLLHFSNRPSDVFAADEQRPRNNDKKRNNDDDEKNNNMAAIEQDVIESTRARLDLQRVANTVLISDEDRIGKAVDQGMTLTWKISLAAAFGAGSVTYLVFKNVVVAGVAAFATAVAAMGDPLEEESIAGALARVVGRFTLQSVDATQSKLRAIARAVIMGEEEEISVLQGQLQAMEQEVSELRRWKQLRIAVDEALPNVALDDLKELARNNGITVGGTKAQLLMRLVEAGIINL